MLDPKKKAQEIADEANDLSAAFARVFNTPDGQRVLGDLNQHFLINDVPQNGDHAYFSGAKTVMVYILKHTQQGLTYAHTRKPRADV